MFCLDQSLGFLVSRLASSLRSDLEKHLAASGLTAPQWAVLMRLLQHDAWPQKELGQALGMDKATVGGVVARLAARRLVVRNRDAQDARVLRVSATTEGRALALSVQPLGDKANTHATAALSKSEIAELKRLLIRARACLEGA
jgi:DNA-binding MarR family transcriptional regulator